MIVQIDTREQANMHVLREFAKLGIDTYDAPLEFGDYYNPESGVTVERKKDLVEFANNCGKGHQRFKHELERLDANGGKMYIMIEQNINYDDLVNWTNPRGKIKYRTLKDGTKKPIKPISGAQMKSICDRWLEKHNIEFVFCKKEDSGKKILEILMG